MVGNADSFSWFVGTASCPLSEVATIPSFFPVQPQHGGLSNSTSQNPLFLVVRGMASEAMRCATPHAQVHTS
jgi:hypothetical protein